MFCDRQAMMLPCYHDKFGQHFGRLLAAIPFLMCMLTAIPFCCWAIVMRWRSCAVRASAPNMGNTAASSHETGFDGPELKIHWGEPFKRDYMPGKFWRACDLLCLGKVRVHHYVCCKRASEWSLLGLE